MEYVWVIIFSSVRFLYKKSNQIDLKKKKTKTEPKLVQKCQFRFGSVFYDKTGLNRFGSVLAPFDSVFFRFGFDLVFSVLSL